MAHPKMQRSLMAAGMTTAMLVLPFGASAFALGVDEAAQTVDAVLPDPVADAVDKAVAPVREAVQEETTPIVDQILEAAPEPVREAAGSVTPSAPSTGPVSSSPVTPAAPSSGDAPQGVQAPAPAASASQSSGDASFWRARQALLSQPMTTTPFPAIADMLSMDAPMAADAERGTRSAAVPSTSAAGWLVATATGLLVALGAAHVAYADGRISKGARTTTA